MTDPKDAPARYSDEANLEPEPVGPRCPNCGEPDDEHSAEQAKECVQECTWPLPEVEVDRVDVDEAPLVAPLEWATRIDDPIKRISASLRFQKELEKFDSFGHEGPGTTYSVTVKLSREASDRINEWLRSEELRRRRRR